MLFLGHCEIRAEKYRREKTVRKHKSYSIKNEMIKQLFLPIECLVCQDLSQTL